MARALLISAAAARFFVPLNVAPPRPPVAAPAPQTAPFPQSAGVSAGFFPPSAPAPPRRWEAFAPAAARRGAPPQMIAEALFAPSVADALVASFSIIVSSEIGDKTFFVAAIMSMQENPLLVYAGAASALAVQTVLSAGAGWLVPTLFSAQVAHWLFVALFFIFGIKLLMQASAMKGDAPSEELEETEQELTAAGKPVAGAIADAPLTSGGVFVKAFVATFLAEWGDRSQIATIALAAEKGVFGVAVGGILGHALCTAIACVGGKILARRISERVVTYVGGVLFLFFAAQTALD